MANQQLGLSFRVPTGFIVTNEATTHPAINLALPTKWRRTVRSTTTGTWNLDLDFGDAVPLDGVWLHHCNFAAVQLAKSDNGSAWTNLSASPQAIGVDDRCTPPLRRKVWLPASSWTSTFNNRYLRLTPSSGDAGFTYWELGSVVCPVIEAMTRNWGTPFVWTPQEPVTRSRYASGGSEINVEGPTLLRFQLQGGPWATEALPQLRQLRALGQDGAVFLYENRGNTAHAYLLKRVADVQFSERVSSFDAPWEFEECV